VRLQAAIPVASGWNGGDRESSTRLFGAGARHTFRESGLREHAVAARLEEHFENIRAFVDYLMTQANDKILPPDGYGDHLSIAGGHHQSDPPLAAASAFL